MWTGGPRRRPSMAIARHRPSVVGRRMTLDEFLELPEEKPSLELIGGVVRQKVSPQEQHGALQFDLAELINRYARPRRLARVFTELRFIVGGDFVVPDISVYRWDRVNRLPSGEIGNIYSGPPDIVVE